MKKNFFIYFISIIMLASCANYYSVPQNNDPFSIIRPHNTRNSLFNWTNVNITKIDGKLAGINLSSTAKIHPGNHDLTINIQFNEGLMAGGPYESFVDVRAHFKPNTSYFIQSKIQGSKLVTWITDSQGNKISNEVYSNYQTQPINNVVYIHSHR